MALPHEQVTFHLLFFGSFKIPPNHFHIYFRFRFTSTTTCFSYYDFFSKTILQCYVYWRTTIEIRIRHIHTYDSPPATMETDPGMCTFIEKSLKKQCLLWMDTGYYPTHPSLQTKAYTHAISSATRYTHTTGIYC